ncbi:Protein kinase-like domain [Pseudocohnilembus persalinus]|uniref:Protein kinase-like domain n=1 Tax=Pseudocohnilembus persalinus TaxID=266149 RepID=A0A0V0QIU6_PSEPJ|nr:Protein kinase-like domain [Pseudocohnilembus persalinus]|eukprot:KRX02076.1 Protein kinase-like domain [Pseudocohnilembus persalinus]
MGQKIEKATQDEMDQIFRNINKTFLIACLILALGAIHKKNVVNLGLTLEHILIDEKGYPRISNFSQAIILDKNKINLQILNNDLITEFVAPEILQRQQPGIEADFYSLGIIMAYLMSGKKNEEQQQLTRKQLINNILKKNFKNVQQSDLPEGWTDLAGDFVNKLTQKKAQNRLGYYGFEELQGHHWVDNIPWQKIEQRLLVDHYIPKIKKNESFTMFRMINNEISNNQSQAQEQVLPAQAKKLIRRISFQEVFEPYYYSAEQQSDDEDGMCQDDIRSLKSNRVQYHFYIDWIQN